MAIRITYDSKNIDLEIGENGLQPELSQEQSQNRSGSGKIETINHYGDEILTFAAEFSEAIYYDLIAWWSWARQGKVWSFAMDSGNTGNTTLDGAAAAAQKVIPLTATASFSVGGICLIAMDDDDAFEVVEIDSISAGVSVTAVENLKFTYASGDAFRHLEYYPEVVMPKGEKFKPNRSGSTYSYVFKFIVKK